MKNLGKYSMGIGDRFGHQAEAQLSAIIKAKELGFDITPVWNKSYREHQIIHSQPSNTRFKADEAVKRLNWKGNYFVDADHIGMDTVELFIDSSDFYTIDVADSIGISPENDDLEKFLSENKKFIGELDLPNSSLKIIVTEKILENAGKKYLTAIKQAGKIYRKIEQLKGKGNFVTEVSMDETDEPQSPSEFFFILSAIASEKIPVQTIAPKFSGRFNKGVDYVGDVERFKKEFELDLMVIAKAVEIFDLPKDLKLSVHSGSDKFSIYKPIKDALKKFNEGLHIKTAGTTWLEELIGLGASEGDGLEMAKEIYSKAFERFDELCGPYKTVIDIDSKFLPLPDEVKGWNGAKFAQTLRHDLSNENYNKHFRQMLHVSYKIAAELGDRYIDALIKYKEQIAVNVEENILERHIKRIFPLE